MDPQKNTNPAANGDEPVAPTTQQTTSTADINMGQEAPATPPVETMPVDTDPMPAPNPSVEMNPTPSLDTSTPDAQTGLASEASTNPTSSAAPASDVPTMPTPGATGAPDISNSMGMPPSGDASTPVQDQVVPSMAPVPAASVRNDKRTIMVLLVVAVLLIGAIAALYFL
ncbi:MAG TPA: hypothetical protein VIR03_02975 [Candidatus Saccharimonadales bacterium]